MKEKEKILNRMKAREEERLREQLGKAGQCWVWIDGKNYLAENLTDLIDLLSLREISRKESMVYARIAIAAAFAIVITLTTVAFLSC